VQRDRPKQGDPPEEPTLDALPHNAVATSRTPGFDVARALAILGMVLVNYKGKLDPAFDHMRADDRFRMVVEKLIAPL